MQACPDPGKLNEGAGMRAVKEPPVSESHPELFHYTDLTALEGMLASGTLWATHARHLYDSSEFEQMWDRIKPRLAVYFLEAARSHPNRLSEHQDDFDSECP